MRIALAAAVAAVLWAALPAQAQITIQPGPQAGAQFVRDNARGTVWCEIVPLVGTPPNVVAHIYNSSPVDECTEEKTANLDVAKLTKDLGVSKVVINPGRYWTLDRATAFSSGEVVDFNGIKAQWGATMTPQDVANLLGTKPFTVAEIVRDTEWFFSKGKPVYLLRTPEGKVWVLQVFSKLVDKTLSMDTLDQLGRKIQMPAGWTFEVKVLDRDLSLQPRWAKGAAYIMRDNLGNTYMGCGFDAACSFVP